MRIFNTLSGDKEDFTTPDGKVGMYVCGPTVYDMPHLGHARVEIVFDIVRRWLEYRHFDVTYVQNITDVDDKIIRRAGEQGISEKELAEKYTKVFFADCKKLGVKPSTSYPRATEHIPGMIALVQKLLENGHAYVVEDAGVYYDISKFAEYGKLSHQSTEQLKAGARVEVEERKRNPLDFALWKSAKPDEPSWDSPWGKGRPGWHIECSVMSAKYVERLDIHGGGRDLIFPHHENEMAQSEGAYGKQFARFWMHNGFINVNSEKMSKSLGNFKTIRAVLKGHEAEAVRLFMLSTHYRGPIDFTPEQLDQAASSLEGLRRTKELAEEALARGRTEGEPIKKRVKEVVKKFEEAMDDDFTTPNALAVLYELSSLINENLDKTPAKDLAYALSKYKKLAGVLGLKLKPKKVKARRIGPQLPAFVNEVHGKIRAATNEIPLPSDLPKGEDDLITHLVDLRGEVRKKGLYAISDEIRAKLGGMGVVIEDTAQGAKWRRY
ncbi:MAG: cysteine--tRNA ligase [Candidatus Burarchaeum sp.]|nr:cysteine--tRNA ligase [Candidatus Burarchaeum sp.]MDO8339950.1 cysteine--tRNA ligase [Candidatus Burarchaeum sp.]